jgi:glycosyltransferase involved in cell wall biosynthesis
MESQKFLDGERKLNIAFLSAGLGNISRGFEISTNTWYNHVKLQDQISARLFSGGTFNGSTRIWNWPRDGKIAALLRKIGLINDGCRLEQLTYSFGFLLQLLIYKPDIIWLQEATLAKMLLTFRNVFSLKYRLMFCDGAPVGHVFAKQFDYQIYLHQFALNEATMSGTQAERCAVIPHICKEPSHLVTKSDARKSLEIDNDQFVLLCVAAWNIHHKRIDYLLKEIANCSKDILLLLCGQPESETPYLQQLAAELNLNVRWHTFSQDDLANAYVAADLFVLPSLNEGLGAVLIEAGLYGLPVVCHPHNAAKFIFGEDYSGFVDFTIEGNLQRKIEDCTTMDRLMIEGEETRKIVQKKFNSKKLTHDFINFLNHTSYSKTN